MKKEDLLYYIWLSLRCGAGSEAGAFMISEFGSPRDVYFAKREEIAKICESDATVDALCDKDMRMPKKILSYCMENGIGILTCDSEYYPSGLKNIYAKPIVLYCRGKLRNFDKNVLITCVGTRKCTDYGKSMAYKMGAELAMGGAFVVSGMALGIDSMSQRGALSVSGYTVAVLGCGIDVIYPPENKELYDAIAENGLIITEFAPGTEPYAKNFPIRNRIMSGISNGTVVIEAGKSSGAMITAEKAMEQGKPLFAVPGDVGSAGSDGTNDLIMRGAKLVTCAKDVLCEYELLYPQKIFTERIKTIHFVKKSGTKITYIKEEPEEEAPKPEKSAGKKKTKAKAEEKSATKDIPEGMDKTEKNILLCLTLPMTADEIFTEYRKRFPDGISEAELLSALTMLEIDGYLEAGAGGKYRRT